VKSVFDSVAEARHRSRRGHDEQVAVLVVRNRHLNTDERFEKSQAACSSEFCVLFRVQIKMTSEPKNGGRQSDRLISIG